MTLMCARVCACGGGGGGGVGGVGGAVRARVVVWWCTCGGDGALEWKRLDGSRVGQERWHGHGHGHGMGMAWAWLLDEQRRVQVCMHMDMVKLSSVPATPRFVCRVS